jgi:hypothetical protein
MEIEAGCPTSREWSACCPASGMATETVNACTCVRILFLVPSTIVLAVQH